MRKQRSVVNRPLLKGLRISLNHRSRKAKVENRRRSIMPEAFPKPFARKWFITLLPTKLMDSERFSYKRFDATVPFGGTSTRAFLTENGKCSLPSTHHTYIHLLCVA